MVHYTSVKIPYLNRTIFIAKRNNQVCRISFSKNGNRFVKLLNMEFGEKIVNSKVRLRNEITQLKQYFEGKRKEFKFGLYLVGTEFQKKVWKQMMKIKYGETISYLTLAERINNKNAVRAVGNACGRNPISVVVPCHRVIANDGSLGGFGGGLGLKKRMLKLEKVSV